MTAPDLAAIEARAKAATQGPWDHEPFDGSFGVYSLEMRDNGDFPAIVGYYASEGEGASEADAEFIAHARTDIPALLALLRERQAKLEAVQGLAMAQQRRLEQIIAAWEMHGPGAQSVTRKHWPALACALDFAAIEDSLAKANATE